MKNIYDLIIVGGGPAGITAGIYAVRQNIKLLLITKELGGQLGEKAVAIENYTGFESISGMELIKKFESHLKKQKIEIEEDEAIKIEKKEGIFLITTKKKKEFESKTVIVSSGADPRPLEVPGEKEFIGRGVSYCVLCDGPMFSGKTVAVIGGGNAGFEAAIFLAQITKKVYILEFSEQIKADAENQERVKKIENIEIITQVASKEIKGSQFVESLIYQDRKTQELKTLKTDGVFVEIGNQPATSFLGNLVDFNERDEIKVEPENLQTKTPGLFAAGDVNVGKYKQIITACGEGAKAALASYDYLLKLKDKK